MNDIPALSLGTFSLKRQQAIDSVSMGLELGYRHIDTAQVYRTEAEVGRAIAASGVPRNELFVTTKIWSDKLAKDQMFTSLRESLSKLQMEQVDLALIHGSMVGASMPVSKYMTNLLEAKRQWIARSIGISNFTVAHMQQAIETIGAAEVATNQVEIHPFLQNRKVVEFARQNDLHLTAYMPLAYGRVMEDPVLQKVAREHEASPAEVPLAWLLQQGFAVIPSSTKRRHLESNLAAKRLRLTPANMAAIAALDRNERLANPGFAPNWD